jgi:hypothetical protein
MALSDIQLRALRGGETPYRRFDGKGLYIEVFPNGSRLWRLKFRHAGKEKRLALGSYPEVTLAAARKQRDAARALMSEGHDPAQKRKSDKRRAKLEADNSFSAIATEFIDTKMTREGRSEATLVKARWFLDLLRPSLGQRPITAIEPAEMLEPLRKLEGKGFHETARRCRAFASRVFRYAVATGRASADPAHLLRGGLIAPKVKHHAAILEPKKFGELLRAIEDFPEVQ